MNASNELPILLFETSESWDSWLAKNPEAAGAWLKFAKKNSAIKSINHEQALRTALCYGWIDGQAKTLDEHFYLQRFTPRTAKSPWSARNCSIAEELIAARDMQPAGQREVDKAKADGRWHAAYASPANAQVPQDFLDKLAKYPNAQAFYKTLNKTNTYAIYYRLHTAKKPETRAARMVKIIAMLENGQKFH